ncbi:hypothetical protein GCK32_001058 [Trichostrongylus colubriformis]|uniref:Uncharacterized protein n=1 Tax=Trichostrongylus colubriformis TaxID=6319 RepID=A0AAN8FIJ3_TRICO
MDGIAVFRKMNGSEVQFYIIFSKTHKEAFRCDGGLELPIGVWMRLQYTGENCSGGYLNSRHLQVIKNIAAPRYTHARLVRRSAGTGQLTDHVVILTLLAFVEFSRTGELSLISDDVGYIMVDQDEIVQESLRSCLEKGAIVEVEFVNGSWWLRNVLGEWHEGIDLSNPDLRCRRNGFNLTEDQSRSEKIRLKEIARPFSSPPGSSSSQFEDYLQENLRKCRSGEESFPNMGHKPAEQSWIAERERPMDDGSFATAAHVESDAIGERMERLSMSSNVLRRRHTSYETIHSENFTNPAKMLSSDLLGRCTEFREMTLENCPIGCSERNDNVVPRWIPPALPPSYEAMVDVKTERPMGIKSLPAWCCIVKIREDHIICFAPIPGIHKILVTGDLVRQVFLLILNFFGIDSLCITGGMKFLELGQWINIECEPRSHRIYDDIRPPHFSHIATKICTVPQRHPPLEPWNQRIVYNTLQIFLRCDLSIPGNVKRVQVSSDKYFLLNCMHKIPMMAPARRLEGIVDTKLTANQQIGMWATRKKRIGDCDMFLIDSEDIVEIDDEPINKCV